MRNGAGGLKGIHKSRFLSLNPDSSRRCVRFPARSLALSDEFAVLGLTPFASKTDVRNAYKRLALKYHPDVMRGGREKPDIFKEIKAAYENLIIKFEEEEEEEESTMQSDIYTDEYDEWEEWMGCEGGMPVVYNPS